MTQEDWSGTGETSQTSELGSRSEPSAVTADDDATELAAAIPARTRSSSRSSSRSGSKKKAGPRGSPPRRSRRQRRSRLPSGRPLRRRRPPARRPPLARRLHARPRPARPRPARSRLRSARPLRSGRPPHARRRPARRRRPRKTTARKTTARKKSTAKRKAAPKRKTAARKTTARKTNCSEDNGPQVDRKAEGRSQAEDRSSEDDGPQDHSAQDDRSQDGVAPQEVGNAPNVRPHRVRGAWTFDVPAPLPRSLGFAPDAAEDSRSRCRSGSATARRSSCSSRSTSGCTASRRRTTSRLIGTDARRGKLTLFDAEGPRERGALKHVALRVSDLAAARAALPTGRPDVFDVGEGVFLTLVEAATDVEYDLDHVALFSADPEGDLAEYERYGFTAAGATRVEVGGRVDRVPFGLARRAREATAQPSRRARRFR